MYYDKETRFMVNQSVNKFYNQFLFNIDALSQKEVFLLDIVEAFFNNLIPNLWEVLVSDVFYIPTRTPAETNNQGNQRLILVRKSEVGDDKNIRTIKASFQPVRDIWHPRKLIVIHRWGVIFNKNVRIGRKHQLQVWCIRKKHHHPHK